MAISLQNYVSITSGVGAGVAAPARQLVGRFFTANNLLPPQSFISFTSATDVANYFGSHSEEFYRAQFYFGWVSKNQTTPPSIQFARWVNVAANPMIFPVPASSTLPYTGWASVTNGSFILTMGGFTFTLSSLDFSAATSLADVATVLQTAIRAQSGGGAMWTSATVTYSSTYSTAGGFLLVGGANGVITNPIAINAGGGGTDITGASYLAWLPQQVDVNGNLVTGAIWSTGSAVETITATLTASDNASDNFGSFAFLNNLSLTLAQVIEAATWNNSKNVKYLFSQNVTPANASAWTNTSTGVGAIGGCALTLTSPTFTQVGVLSSGVNTVTGLSNTAVMKVGMPISGTDIPTGTTIASIASATSITMSANATGTITEAITFYPLEFPEQAPMMIEAATNYSALNSVQNYMYQSFPGLTASVTTDASYNAYNALSINFYGTTQTAGNNISFYQQGVMQGLATNILDMNSYVNEVWLRNAAEVAILNLLLALSQVSANQQGENQILATLQGVINQALNNGTISVGKSLTTLQQTFITNETGDPLAWYQVQNSGYWVGVSVDPTTHIATYTLIYSKDDVIRKVVGIHTLI